MIYLQRYSLIYPQRMSLRIHHPQKYFLNIDRERERNQEQTEKWERKNNISEDRQSSDSEDWSRSSETCNETAPQRLSNTRHFFTDLVETWNGVSKWKNSTYAHYLSCQTSLPPNQPTNQKVINVHIFGVFQPIWLKFGMESLNGRTQHMYVIYLCLSMLTGQTNLPPNQLTGLKVKTYINWTFFNQIGWNLVWSL